MSEVKTKKNDSILSHFLIIGSGTFINVLLGLITAPIITRIVDPVDNGKMGMFNLYASIGLMVFLLGLDQSLVRFYYEKDSREYKAGLLKLCVFLPTVVTLIVSIIVLVLSFTKPDLFEFETPTMILLCVYTLFSIWNRISLLLLRVNYKSKYYALCSIVSRVVYLSVVLIFALRFRDKHFLILIIATMLSMMTSTLISMRVNKESWNMSGSIANSREIIRYGLPFVLSLGLTTLFQAIDKLSLNAFCTYREVGIYTTALSIITVFEVVQTTFNTLWSPMQIEHYVNDPEDRSFIQKGNQYITIIMFFLGLCLILSRNVISLLLGEKYREVAAILPFLVFNPIMYTISETTHGGIEFKKKSYYNIVIALVACIVNVTGNLLLVPRYACEGAAMSTGISYIVFFALRTYFSLSLYKADYKLWRFTIMTVMALVFAFYNTFYDSFIVSLMMFIICMGALLFLYRDSLKDLIDFIFSQLNLKKSKQ